MVYGTCQRKLDWIDIYKQLAINLQAWAAAASDIHEAGLSFSRSQSKKVKHLGFWCTSCAIFINV